MVHWLVVVHDWLLNVFAVLPEAQSVIQFPVTKA